MIGERLEDGRRAKEDRKWMRLRDQFKTCEYPNKGAYTEIPTIRGNLRDQVDNDRRRLGLDPK